MDATADLFVEFKGWRFRPPFRCMNCGKMITVQQFCFARCCGGCDAGERSNTGLVFSGPRAIADANHVNFIAPGAFSNPETGLESHPNDKDFPNHVEIMARLAGLGKKNFDWVPPEVRYDGPQPEDFHEFDAWADARREWFAKKIGEEMMEKKKK